MDGLEVLRSIVVVVHLLGWATLFGAWVAEAVTRRYRATALMNWGLVIALVTGIVLTAPWPAGADPNGIKALVKLGLVVVIGALAGIGTARQRRGANVPAWMFWAIGVLTATNVAIAVIWGYDVP